jgi:hypothetical protein
MKSKKLPPQFVNWAQPQWRHAASGIRCRADWKNAFVYDTDAGLIIAYSQAHADDAAREVLLDQEAHGETEERETQLWELAE